ncbi:MAG: FtsW/RodA/SpoVE family cell cycle protein, partial [Pseudomonadota bacterium]
NTLADALEWQRRASAYRERGFALAQLQALPAMLWASSVLLFLVVAFTSRGSLAALVVWSVASQLLGLGALMLTDLALTGEPALRYLAERQFMSFGLGDVWLKLTLALPWPAAFGGGVLMLWWPLLVLAVCLLLLRAVRDGAGWALAPVRAWVRGGAEPRWGAAQSALLLASGTLLVLFLGMPAAVSELLILLGCVGVASYLARQAPHANAGANLQIYNLAVVAGALLLAVAGSVLRGDLGHALVALLLAACFAWLFGWTWMRWGVLVCTATAFAALLVCLVAGKLTGPLAWLAKVLPPHAQDRIYAMFDPMHAGSSDMARIRWLIDSAGLPGWGMAYAPWQGLAARRVQDGLPLQGPSDYVMALTSTLWGQAGGLAIMALVLLVFTIAAFTGLRTALRPAMPMAVRWLAALGGFGCVVMAAKVVLSVGGVTGVLPLTGLPVSLLGYGPVTHLAALMYLALAMGTAHVEGASKQRGVNIQAPLTTTGAVRRRGLSLAIASVAGLAGLLALGYRHMRADDGALGQRHVAQARLELAQALTHAMVPAAGDANPSGPSDPRASCDELNNAVAAWNQRLGALAKPVRVTVLAETEGATPHKSTVVTQALHL